MLAPTSTYSKHIYMLSQSTVALRVSRSYSKVAYLKQSKYRIVYLLSFFLLSSSPVILELYH